MFCEGKHSLSKTFYYSPLLHDVCSSLAKFAATQAAFCRNPKDIASHPASNSAQDKAKQAPEPYVQSPSTALRYCATAHPLSLLLSVLLLLWLETAAPSTTFATAANSVSFITSIQHSCAVLYFASKQGNGNLLRRIISGQCPAYSSPPQQFSSRQLQLLHQRALYHLFQTEHYSVKQFFRTRPSRSLPTTSNYNIFHSSCYRLARGLPRKML